MENFGPLTVPFLAKRGDSSSWGAISSTESLESRSKGFELSCQWRDSTGEVWLDIFDNGEIVFCRFVDGCSFQIDLVNKDIFLLESSCWNEDALRHLRNHILPLIVQSSGELVLHASAVCLASSAQPAVLFVGRSGVGKSTLAAYLAERHPLLADDASLLSFVEDDVLVAATSCSVSLWPGSQALLKVDSLEESKRLKEEFSRTRAEKGATLRAVFFLGAESEELQTRELVGSEIVQALQANVLTMRPHSSELNAQIFEKLVGLAQRVPCYELQYSPGVAGLQAIESYLIENFT